MSLLTPSEFGLLLHFTCLVAGSPSRDWQLHICFASVDVLAGNCRQGSSTVCASKIYIYISEKLMCELPGSRFVVISVICVCF